MLGSFKSIEALFVDVASRQSVQTSVGSLAFSLLVTATRAVTSPKKQTTVHESRNTIEAILKVGQ